VNRDTDVRVESPPPRACVRAAAFPMIGLEQPVDRARAVSLLRAACTQGNWIGCVYEIIACGKRDGGCDAQVALDILDQRGSVVKRACYDEGNGDACLLLVFDGLRQSPKVPRAELLALLDKSCKLGALDGCTVNGMTSFFEASPGHEIELAAYEYACERGNGEACGAVANSYGIDARERRPQKELYLDKACHSEPSAYYLGGSMGGVPMLATTCGSLFRALENSDDPAEKARSEEAKRLSCKLGAAPACALLEK